MHLAALLRRSIKLDQWAKATIVTRWPFLNKRLSLVHTEGETLNFIKQPNLDGLCILLVMVTVIDRFNSPRHLRLYDYVLLTGTWLVYAIIRHAYRQFREKRHKQG